MQSSLWGLESKSLWLLGKTDPQPLCLGYRDIGSGSRNEAGSGHGVRREMGGQGQKGRPSQKGRGCSVRLKMVRTS